MFSCLYHYLPTVIGSMVRTRLFCHIDHRSVVLFAWLICWALPDFRRFHDGLFLWCGYVAATAAVSCMYVAGGVF